MDWFRERILPFLEDQLLPVVAVLLVLTGAVFTFDLETAPIGFIYGGACFCIGIALAKLWEKKS